MPESVGIGGIGAATGAGKAAGDVGAAAAVDAGVAAGADAGITAGGLAATDIAGSGALAATAADAAIAPGVAAGLGGAAAAGTAADLGATDLAATDIAGSGALASTGADAALAPALTDTATLGSQTISAPFATTTPAATSDITATPLASPAQAASTTAATPTTGAAGGGGGAFVAPSAPATPFAGGASATAGPQALGLSSQDVIPSGFDITAGAPTTTGGGTAALTAGPATSPLSGLAGSVGSTLSNNAGWLVPAAALGFEALNQPSMPSPQGLTGNLTGIATPETTAGTSLLNTGQSIITQGQGLVQPLASGAGPGSLPSGAEAELSQATQSAIATIRSQYASMGLSGSTMEQQAINEVQSNALTQRYNIATQMAQTGLNEINTGEGVTGQGTGALNSASSIYSNLLNQSLQSDAALQSAVSGFAGQVAASQNPTNIATLAALTQLNNNQANQAA